MYIKSTFWIVNLINLIDLFLRIRVLLLYDLVILIVKKSLYIFYLY